MNENETEFCAKLERRRITVVVVWNYKNNTNTAVTVMFLLPQTVFGIMFTSGHRTHNLHRIFNSDDRYLSDN